MAEEKKQVRVWVDGCFDMMHYGHSNALRKAKAMGDYLIVGVHSDAEIARNKGPPVTQESERYALVRACRWVDEIVEDAPYLTTLETLNKYNCDFCVHGDDIVIDCNGKDTYAEVKDAGKFKIFPRTEGVSTTDLVGRMLLAIGKQDIEEEEKFSNYEDMSQGTHPLTSEKTQIRKFNSTTGKSEIILQGRSAKPTEHIGYINGSFDLFHHGHVSILERARQQCDYLIVGLFPSNLVREKKGTEWPIMSLQERGLTCLACKYVDCVILGVPWDVSEGFIDELNSLNEIRLSIFSGRAVDPAYKDKEANDGLDNARSEDMLVVLNSRSEIQATTIIERIINNRSAYLKRQEIKQEKEKAGFS